MMQPANWININNTNDKTCPVCQKGRKEGNTYCSVSSSGREVRCEKAHKMGLGDKVGEWRRFTPHASIQSDAYFYTLEPEIQKKPRPANHRTWVYHRKTGEPGVMVGRIDHGLDSDKDKTTYQKKWNRQKQEWIKNLQGFDRKELKVLNQDKAEAAKAQGKMILIVEGEQVADTVNDLLRDLGHVAVTSIGGSGFFSKTFWEFLYGYTNVVLCPDRDQGGVKYMKKVAEATGATKWLYTKPDSHAWKALNSSNGIDLHDWIIEGATIDMVLGSITESQVQPIIPENSQTPPHQPRSKVDIAEIESIIERIIGEDLCGSKLISRLNKLAKDTGITARELHRIHAEKLLESDQSQSLSDGYIDLERLIKASQEGIDVYRLFPREIADAITSKAESDGIDPVYMVQALLPTFAIFLGSKWSVIGKEGAPPDPDELEELGFNEEDELLGRDHWLEYTNGCWATVDHPSSGKSNATNSMYKLLRWMNGKAWDKYEQQKRRIDELEDLKPSLNEEQKQELKELKLEHNLRVYMINKGTPESVWRRTSEQGKKAGIGWFSDELNGLFASLNRYNSGGGAIENILEAFNGPMNWTVQRVSLSNSYRMSGQTMSIFGSIQPSVAEKVFSTREDGNGLLSRFCVAIPRVMKNATKWSEGQGVKLTPIVGRLFRYLDMQGDNLCRFSPDAYERWNRRWETLKEGYYRNRETNPALGYFYGKQCSYVLRFALILHAAECCFSPKKKIGIITLDTLEKAIYLSDYYIGQLRILQTMGRDRDKENLDGVVLKVIAKCKSQGKISKRQVHQNFGKKKFGERYVTTEIALEIFNVITKSGFGYLKDGVLYAEPPEDESLPPDDKGTPPTPPPTDVPCSEQDEATLETPCKSIQFAKQESNPVPIDTISEPVTSQEDLDLEPEPEPESSAGSDQEESDLDERRFKDLMFKGTGSMYKVVTSPPDKYGYTFTALVTDEYNGYKITPRRIGSSDCFLNRVVICVDGKDYIYKLGDRHDPNNKWITVDDGTCSPLSGYKQVKVKDCKLFEYHDARTQREREVITRKIQDQKKRAELPIT
ncbi:MAG: DUF3987 domain-containing protein [Moorea sp. SIO4A3]|nr:DUF3987 domain-containing protein [Moorena sp. SIO4A3]